jgi:hypothetical protein
MGDEPQPGVATTLHTMEVGYNYPWAFNKYGLHIGPRDLEHEPPLGTNSDVPMFRDTVANPPEGTLAKNLTFLRDELNIRKVRMFLLCNAWNYGSRPLVSKGIFFVPDLHPLFLKHFRSMLEVFAAKEMQILPSLIDFAAFYELDGPNQGAGSGRTEIARTGRKKFFETVLTPFLEIAKEPGLRKTIFAWEVINEPRWPLTQSPPFAPPRPHTRTTGPDLGTDEMAVFISEALALIQSAGFESTVGHRFLDDLKSLMPTGTKPQFHYYALTVPFVAKISIPGDPPSIPLFADLSADSRTKNAFVGEFHSDPNRLWPDCAGTDNSLRTAAFQRLSVLEKKGYKLAFIWPDGGPPDADKVDGLKISPDTILSIKQFTRGQAPASSG